MHLLLDQAQRLELQMDYNERKRRGAFFTPPQQALAMLQKLSFARKDPRDEGPLWDPSLGSGVFLLGAVLLLHKEGLRRNISKGEMARIFQEKLGGIDIDASSLQTARHLLEALFLELGYTTVPLPQLYHGNPWDFHLSPAYLVGNPPYVSQKANQDLYLVFLAWILGHQVAFSLILPDPFIIRDNAMTVRQMLIQPKKEVWIEHRRNLFAAGVANVIVTRTDKDASGILFTAKERTYVRSYEELAEDPKTAFRYLIPPTLYKRFLDLYKGGGPLGRLSDRFYDFRGEEIGKRQAQTSTEGVLALASSTTLTHGGLCQADGYLPAQQLKKAQNKRPESQLVVAKSTPYFTVSYDPLGHVLVQTLYGLRKKESGDLSDILQLLAHPFYRYYLYVMETGYKWVQPQIEQEDLKNLPLLDADTFFHATEKEIFLEEARLLNIAPA